MTTGCTAISGMTVVLGHRKVSKGDIILTSVPFVYILNTRYKGLYCDTCLKRKQQSFQRCSGCAVEWYCNRECQRGSWDIHRFECKNLARIKPLVPPDTAKLLSRVIIRMKNGGEQVEENLTETKTRKFKELMNHYRDIKDDEMRQEHLLSLKVVLERYLGSSYLPNDADLQGIYGRVIVNSFSMTDSDMNGIGTGVYLAASVFDHSCEPNAFVTFLGKHLICRSLIDWPTLDWTKIRISYIDILNSTTDRMNDLHKRYYFWCDCNMCHNKARDKIMSSINCGNTSCDAPVHIDEDGDVGVSKEACSKCGFNDFSPDTRSNYIEAAKYSREKLDMMKDKYYIDLCKMALDKQGSLFHKFNILRVRILDAGFEAAIDLGNWDTAVEFGAKNMDGIRFYYGINHPSYGMVMLKLAKIYSYMGKLKEALVLLRDAESILRVSHGTSHPTYKDELRPLLVDTQNEINFTS